MTERYKYRSFLPLNGRIHSNPPAPCHCLLNSTTTMSPLVELKTRLEAARVEREQQERETHEQEERELQRMMEEEELARREQQRAEEEEEEKKRAEQEQIAEEEHERVEAEQVAEGQQNTRDVGGEGSKEADRATGVTETTGESWEDEIARLQPAAMAGGSKDGGEEYQATEETCWNCQHQKLVCERPE